VNAPFGCAFTFELTEPVLIETISLPEQEELLSRAWDYSVCQIEVSTCVVTIGGDQLPVPSRQIGRRQNIKRLVGRSTGATQDELPAEKFGAGNTWSGSGARHHVYCAAVQLRGVPRQSGPWSRRCNGSEGTRIGAGAKHLETVAGGQWRSADVLQT